MEFDPKTHERIIRKIKHCLALSASTNEHEAAAAMRQARKLMQKYRINETDVHLSDVSKTKGAHSKSTRHAWDRNLTNVVAQTFNCRAYSFSSWDSVAGGRRERAMFVGVTPAPEIAKYAYDTLYFKVSDARREYISKIRKGEVPLGRYTPETRGNHFAEAWVSQVHEKLSALVPEPDETPDHAHSNERALALAEQHDNALIEAFMHQLTSGNGPTKARARKGADANVSDVVAGMLAGRQVDVNHGLDSAGHERLTAAAPKNSCGL